MTNGAGRGIVGKLGVKVVPNLDGFASELRRELRAVQAAVDDVEVVFKAKVDLDDASLARAKRDLDQAMARSRVRVLLDKASASKLTSAVEAATGKVKVAVDDNDIEEVRQRIREVASDIEVDPKVTEATKGRLRRALAGINASVSPDVSPTDLRLLRGRIERVVSDIEIDAKLSAAAAERFRSQVDDLAEDLRLTPKLDHVAMAEIKARVQKLMRNVEMSAELSQKSKEHIKHQLNSIDAEATVNADADTGMAQAKLKWLTRDRWVKIIPILDNGATNAVITGLAALSGARALKEVGTNLKDLLVDLDKTAMRAGITASAVLTLASAVISLGGNLTVLAVELAKLAPALLALPGLAIGAAVGLGVFITGMLDLKTVLPDVVEQFSGLRQVISASFWRRAAQPMRELTYEIMPVLEARMSGIAQAQGGWVAAFSSVATTKLETLDDLLANVEQGTLKATKGIRDMTRGILALGEVGSRYLPTVAAGFNGVMASFAAWAEKGASDGSIERSISKAAAAARKLWQFTTHTATGFRGIYSAATDAGYTLDRLVASSFKFSEAINSVRGQILFTNLFRGAIEGVDNFTAKVSNLGDEFTKVSRTARLAMSLSGSALGSVVSILAKSASTDAFNSGIRDLFEGVISGLAGLEKASPQIGEFAGAVASLAGTLAENLGKVLGAAFTTLGPAVSRILIALKPLAEWLGDKLVSAIQKAEPWLNKFAKWIEDTPPDKLAGIAAGIAGVALAFKAISGITAAASGLSSLASVISTLTGGAGAAGGAGGLAGLASGLARIAGPAALVVGAIMAVAGATIYLYQNSEVFRDMVGSAWESIQEKATAFSEYFNANIKPVLINAWNDIQAGGQAFVDWFDTELAPVLSAFFESISTLWNEIGSPALDAISETLAAFGVDWQFLWDTFKAPIAFAWQLMAGIVSGTIQVITGLINVFLGVITGDWSRAWTGIQQIFAGVWEANRLAVTNAFNAIKNVVTGIVSAVVNGVSGLGSKLVSAGQSLIQGFIDGIKSKTEGVRSALTGITNKLTSWKGPPDKDAVLLTPAGRMVIDGFVKGLEDRYVNVERSLKGLTNRMPDYVAAPDFIEPVGSVNPASVDPGGGDRQGLDKDGVTINITNNNPVAEPESKTRDDAADGIRYAAVL